MSQNNSKNLPAGKALEERLQQMETRMDSLESNLKQLIISTKALADAQTKGQLQTERSMQQLFQPVHIALSKLKSTANLVSRNALRRNKRVIRVVFLVHNVETWDALHEVYQIMLRHERFEPVVISMKRDFLNAQKFGQEEINFNGLTQLGINPIRFNSESPTQELEMLKLMNPDVIFRQSPWDISIQPEFHYHEIDFAKICIVPYGFGSVAMKDEHYNHYFTRSCWRVYAETQLNVERAGKFSFETNLITSGSPKLDRVVQMSEELSWPLPIEPNTVRIIWAPHHSMTPDWLYFSTFPNNYKHFLQLARECPHLQIVLKPHPTLLDKVVAYGIMTPAELRSYLEEFIALPNTAIVTGGNYIPMFWASDLMITDGVGFFAEYMVTGKPLIWTENPGHFPLNEIGQLLQEGMYRADNFEMVVQYLEQLCVDNNDSLLEKRQEIIKQLLPHSEGSAQFIVNDILDGIDNE